VVEGKVKVSKIQRPMGLIMVELFGYHEVLKVLVVYPDFYWMDYSFKKVSSLFQNADDG